MGPADGSFNAIELPTGMLAALASRFPFGGCVYAVTGLAGVGGVVAV